MGKPRSKGELLTDAQRERDLLLAMLATLTPEQLAQSGSNGWSTKDIVAHLAEWERLLFGWYDAGWRGEEPAVPAEGYTWATMAQLNDRIFVQHRDESWGRIFGDWQDTSRRLISLTGSISEADLFTLGRYAWTGRGTLADFVYECGPNHCRWARADIRKALKARR
jgi:hypothetical protein